MFDSSTAGGAFVDEARAYLTRQYVPKIAYCLDRLDENDVWWRPNAHCNSVGNLVLHLNGNIRQYIVSGVGGARDLRDRDEEFAAEEGLSSDKLTVQMRSTIEEVDDVLQSLDPKTLPEERTIQGRSMTVLHAIFHAVEHYSMHTGQILYITKLRIDVDLDFYGFRDGGVQEKWPA